MFDISQCVAVLVNTSAQVFFSDTGWRMIWVQLPFESWVCSWLFLYLIIVLLVKTLSHFQVAVVKLACAPGAWSLSLCVLFECVSLNIQKPNKQKSEWLVRLARVGVTNRIGGILIKKERKKSIHPSIWLDPQCLTEDFDLAAISVPMEMCQSPPPPPLVFILSRIKEGQWDCFWSLCVFEDWAAGASYLLVAPCPQLSALQSLRVRGLRGRAM